MKKRKHFRYFLNKLTNINIFSHEDPRSNRSSTSPCVSLKATEWGGPSDETGKPRPRLTAGVAR
jgi:hypothetical protein